MLRVGMSLAALLLAGWATSASAQTMSYAQAGASIAAACGPAIDKYCGKVNLGNGEIQRCLAEHRAEVPPQCVASYEAAVASIARRVAAQVNSFKVCEPDVRAFCKGVQPGDANILSCLLESSKVVKADCKQVLLDAGWQ